MPLRRYKLKFPVYGISPNAVLTERNSYDYGICADEERLTGIKHVMVTYNPNGDKPGFPIPVGYLDELPEKVQTEE